MKGENDATGINGSNDINAGGKAITIDGKTLGIDDVIEMKKQLTDLGLISESKEKKIMEVCLLEKSIFQIILQSI